MYNQVISILDASLLVRRAVDKAKAIKQHETGFSFLCL